jgi:carbonic anhydrase
MSLSYRSLDLLVGFKKTQGSVTVKNYFTFDGSINTDGGIDWFRFSDGSQISAASLVSDMSQLNTNIRPVSPMLQVIMR